MSNLFQIKMANIWDYEPEGFIPHVDFKMEWKGEEKCFDGMADAIVTGGIEEMSIKLRVSGLLLILNYGYILWHMYVER